MSDNDNNKGSIVTPFRPRLVVPEGAKPVVATTETEPQQSNFDFYLLDGTVYKGRGYMVATSAWVGLGDGTGRIHVIIPMTNLNYVELAEDQSAE
jgi:hypothetical protein